jgi:N12 class adenine-specific DNA methylase
MKAMIGLREALRFQMRSERSYMPAETIEGYRSDLNKLYDDFFRNYGFLNDPVNRRVFIDDTEAALVQSLEFDYEKTITLSKAEELGIEPRAARARKADIFSKRVLYPPVENMKVESAKDALLHCLNVRGRFDMAYIRESYQKDDKTIIDELGDVLYRDPVKGLVMADEYLSGDVKTKLLEAKKAAGVDPQYHKNVAALEHVIPADKLPSEIFISLGGPWVPAEIYSQFAKEISGAEAVFNYSKGTG